MAGGRYPGAGGRSPDIHSGGGCGPASERDSGGPTERKAGSPPAAAGWSGSIRGVHPRRGQVEGVPADRFGFLVNPDMVLIAEVWPAGTSSSLDPALELFEVVEEISAAGGNNDTDPILLNGWGRGHSRPAG